MRNPLAGSKRRIWSIWREIWRHKIYEGGPLTNQCYQFAEGQNEVTREALYLELLSVAPHANGSTRRRWRKALGLSVK